MEDGIDPETDASLMIMDSVVQIGNTGRKGKGTCVDGEQNV